MEYKYREYAFDEGKLFGIRLRKKLPEDAKKIGRVEHEVWSTPDCYGIWSKLCRVGSDIDFGTGRKDVHGDLPQPKE